MSYWGRGALKGTGLRGRLSPSTAAVTIICDLNNPGCNPKTIQKLIESGATVRTLNNFHAKVWICGDSVIVGSAKVSLFGLRFDYQETSQTKVEAAVLIESDELARDVRDWFQNHWKNSDEIKPERMKSALDTWRERRTAIKNSPSFKRSLATKKPKNTALPKERNARYQAFFQALLVGLRKESFSRGKKLKAKAKSRLEFGAGRSHVHYFALFTRGQKAGIELYIGTRSKYWIKQKYFEMLEQKNVIEQKLELEPRDTLSWKRNDQSQHSSIVLTRDGWIDDEDSELEEICEWMVKKLIAFDRVFNKFFE